MLEGLERDVKAVRKARDALGDAAPKLGGPRDRDGERGGARGGFGAGRGGGVLGKRRRDEDGSSEEEEVPEDVRTIPMPRDTPPPIPKEVLDKWYQKRRERMARERDARGTSANAMPLGQNDRRGAAAASVVQAPPMEAKTVYEAKPIVRDLRKEAISFVPAAVRAKLEKSKGLGGLVEPEEADRLEKAGYMGVRRDSERSGNGGGTVEAQNDAPASKSATVEEVEDEDG